MLSTRFCVALDNVSIQEAIEAAMQFRCCTTIIKIGQDVYMEHGPTLVRSLLEMGGYKQIIVDVQLAGDLCTLQRAVRRLAYVGASVITISASVGSRGVQAAVEAACEASSQSLFPQPTQVFVTMPPKKYLATMLPMGLAKNPRNCAKQAPQTYLRDGAHGIIVDASHFRTLLRTAEEHTKKSPYMVIAERGPLDYYRKRAPDNLLGPVELLRAGAAFSCFSTADMPRGQDWEWLAELVRKELEILHKEELKTDSVMELLNAS